jgi:hypothetical protein
MPKTRIDCDDSGNFNDYRLSQKFLTTITTMGAPGIGPGSGKILEISKNPEKFGKNPAVWEILGAPAGFLAARIAPAAPVILQHVMSQAAYLAHIAAKIARVILNTTPGTKSLYGPYTALHGHMPIFRH